MGDLSPLPAGFPTGPIRATVPGCIHTDLIDAGLIRDPRIGDAEAEIQWVSWLDWRYEVEFEADPALLEHEEVDLVFEHLDTIAAIELNGVEVGRASSEFLPWRFSVLDVLTPGRNRLSVTFTSPLRYVQQEAARLGARPVNGEYPAYNMIRKCASNFEWDWGPRVATCGIAGAVGLEGWSGMRIERVRIATGECSSTDQTWALNAEISVAWSRRCVTETVDLRLSLADGPAVETTARRREQPDPMSIVLKRPELWWPTGYGDQKRHQVRLEALTPATPASGYAPESRRVIDRREFWTGFRRSEPASWYDADNFFPLVINHQSAVYCRGANWIPEGLFPRDRTPERVRTRLEQLKAANMNMIRVWGGGRYEPDWFYDICDELGILVWQDFMMACACYPEEEPLWSLIEREARHHVARLSRHPSVVLWCGGNECTWAYTSWGFKEKLQPGQTWGEKYYYTLFRRVCSEIDVPYAPNSPFSLDRGRHPNDPAQGDTHVWEVWGDGYRTVVPRFCSEFGQQSPSNIETLKSAGVLEDPSALIPPLLASRQRGPGGNKRWYEEPIETWFRPPRDFDEWHYLAQLLQARSLTIGIEWQRANMPTCMGSLIWQLNDAWPGLSWSLIDSDGRPKPAYHAVAEAFANRKLTIQPIDGALHVVAINDTNEEWSGQLRVRRMTFDGSLRATADAIPFSLKPRQVDRLCTLEDTLGAPSEPDREFVVAESLSCRALWFYLPDRELQYPAPTLSIVPEDRHTRFRIQASVLVRDMTIRGVTPGMVTLLPGETFLAQMDAPQQAASLASRPAFWCANDFGKPSSA